MELINTVKSGRSLGNDRGKKIYTQKVKDQLPFDIWQFCSGLPDCDDDRKMCRDDFNLWAT